MAFWLKCISFFQPIEHSDWCLIDTVGFYDLKNTAKLDHPTHSVDTPKGSILCTFSSNLDILNQNRSQQVIWHPKYQERRCDQCKPTPKPSKRHQYSPSTPSTQSMKIQMNEKKKNSPSAKTNKSTHSLDLQPLKSTIWQFDIRPLCGTFELLGPTRKLSAPPSREWEGSERGNDRWNWLKG